MTTDILHKLERRTVHRTVLVPNSVRQTELLKSFVYIAGLVWASSLRQSVQVVEAY